MNAPTTTTTTSPVLSLPEGALAVLDRGEWTVLLPAGAGCSRCGARANVLLGVLGGLICSSCAVTAALRGDR